MTSSEKTRLFVYCVFFLAVIALAALYRPADAFTRPAAHSNVMVAE
ncbi:MAG TPA: hypothetical protein VMS18_09525 [Candidatus Binatia bacterium]|nr:hypothetical protein [Candidatus Binatia bacterium]